MATAYHNLSDYDFNSVPNAENMRFGIVVSEWNNNITGPLLEGAISTLKKHGAKDKNILVTLPPIGKLNFRPGNENQTLHDTQSADSVEPVLRFGGGGFGAGLGRPEAGLRPDGSGRRVRLFRRLRSASAQPEFAHRAATGFAGRRHHLRVRARRRDVRFILAVQQSRIARRRAAAR